MNDGMDEMQRRANEEMANWKGDPRTTEITALRAEVNMLRHAASEWRSDLAGSLERESALRAEVASKNEQFQQYARKMETDMNALAAENEKLRAYALKAFTVVEFCSGQGFLLQYPSYNCDDLLMEGVDLLNVETTEEARAALKGETSA